MRSLAFHTASKKEVIKLQKFSCQKKKEKKIELQKSDKSARFTRNNNNDGS